MVRAGQQEHEQAAEAPKQEITTLTRQLAGMNQQQASKSEQVDQLQRQMREVRHSAVCRVAATLNNTTTSVCGSL